MPWLLIVFILTGDLQDWERFRSYEFKTKEQCLAALETGYFAAGKKGAKQILVTCVPKGRAA